MGWMQRGGWELVLQAKQSKHRVVSLKSAGIAGIAGYLPRPREGRVYVCLFHLKPPAAGFEA